MRRLTILALGAMAALGLAACGGEPAPTPTSPGTDPTSTPTATPEPHEPINVPAWVLDLIERFEVEDVTNPPRSIEQRLYRGETVYFVPQICCDVFSDLYDASGELIAHPDGGIAGIGDGRAPDFGSVSTLTRVVWIDGRGPEGRELVDAPIDEARVVRLDDAARYSLYVRSGLSNGCHRFAGWEIDGGRLSSEGLIEVHVRNTVPTAKDIACTEIYGMVESTIPLPFDFDPGAMYSVGVNGMRVEFTPGEIDPQEQARLDAAKLRWAQAGMSSYTARMEWRCFCPAEFRGPVLLVVEDGVLVSATYAEGSELSGPADVSGFATVDGMFDKLQEALDVPAHEVAALYDLSLGYPKQGFIDELEFAIDEERGFTWELITRG